MKGLLGAAGASLALIIANPFGGMSGPSVPSVKAPAISKPAKKDAPAKTATAPPAATKKVEKKKVNAQRKAELKSGYDLSLESEVKSEEKAAVKAKAEEKAAEAVVKKDEAAAKEAAKKEEAALEAEKKARILLLKPFCAINMTSFLISLTHFLLFFGTAGSRGVEGERSRSQGLEGG